MNQNEVLTGRVDVIRQFVRLYSVASLILLTIAVAWGIVHADKQMSVLKVRQEDRIALAAQLFREDLAQAASDLHILVDIADDLVSRVAQSEVEHQLGEVFMTFARNTGRYDQLRYLDVSGRERIRVNFRNGRPVHVAEAELQDKSQRYYVIDTLALTHGKMYVSPLDLNIEHGTIEIPYKPMLRFGMLIHDASGQKRGIIVINQLAGHMLTRFLDILGQDGCQAMLLDNEGYWLASPATEDLWGFMFGNDHTFARRFPDAWRRLTSQARGSYRNRYGLFSHATFFPLTAGQLSSRKATLPVGADSGRFGASEYRWQIVGLIPESQLPTLWFFNDRLQLSIFLVAWALLAAALWPLSVARVRQLAWRVALVESEARFSKVFRNSPVGLAITREEDGRIAEVNDTLCELIAYRPDERIGKTTLELAIWHDPDERALLVRQLQQQGSVENQEMHYRRKSGEIGAGLISMQQLELAEGRFMLSTLIDINARKQAEAELQQTQAAMRESEERFRLLFEQAPIGIAMADVNGHYLRANRVFCDMLDYREEDVLRLRLLDVSHPDDHEANSRLYRKALANELTSYRLRTRFQRRKGDVIWANLHASLIRSASGQPLYSLSIVENITERVNSEQVRRAHEARQRDALVREVHHRIKNNLHGVIAVLQRDIANSPECQNPLEAAIAQVKTISVAYGLQGRYGDQGIQLAELVREVARSAFRMAAIDGEPELTTRLEGTIYLDGNATVTLALILNELVQNAIKHGRPIDDAPLALSLAGDATRVVVSISNPGGPLPETLDLTSGAGCGIGLDLVRTLLPRKGAMLALACHGDRIQADLLLTPPVLAQDSPVLDTAH